MNEEWAREVLGDLLSRGCEKGVLYGEECYWNPLWKDSALLNGVFTPEKLSAILWWMENMKETIRKDYAQGILNAHYCCRCGLYGGPENTLIDPGTDGSGLHPQSCKRDVHIMCKNVLPRRRTHGMD